MRTFDEAAIFRALANPARRQILAWLRDPKGNFEPQGNADAETYGVCLGSIQRRAGISQSMASQHLASLERAGLVVGQRIGQWTHYRRNEEIIGQFRACVAERL